MNRYERLKQLAEKRGMTIAEVERKLGYANGSIRRWANQVPAGDKLVQMADFFAVTPEYILEGDNYSLSKFNSRALNKYIEKLTDEEVNIIEDMIKRFGDK